MAGGGKVNSKKVEGNAKKLAAAAAKANVVKKAEEAAEDEEWKKGAKNTDKKRKAEQQRIEAKRLKDEEKRHALKVEEDSLPSKPVKSNAKAPVKRSRGIDDALSSFSSTGGPSSINASGIDNALDALSLTADAKTAAVDRHPERRFKAAYAAYEERRLPEVKEEHKGLRLNQMKELIRKEFEKSEENPFNQAGIIKYDATRDEVLAKKKEEREKIEKRLGT
ncbi:hypothetical protein RUND412_007793 [Rhizina undulata]